MISALKGIIMVYLYLAEGFEEVEAFAPLDLLRRAGVDVRTVGVTGEFVRGSHGIEVRADLPISKATLSNDLEMIILPGGMPGTKNLESSDAVAKAIEFASGRGIYIAAICAAPTILGSRGLLDGRYAICYPGMEKQLTDAVVLDKPVVVDENIITAKGMGVALEFGMKLCEILCGAEYARHLRSTTVIRP